MINWKEGFFDLAYKIIALDYLLWNFLMSIIVMEAAAHMFISKIASTVGLLPPPATPSS